MAALVKSDNKTLPKKEHDIFKSIAKLYEQKQYKKGIKAADTVLKKFPDHGETLCMKGLCLNSLDKKEEAYALVKLGLKNDMRSHVCWHVHGLLYRSDKEYLKAIQAYKQALRVDPQNMLILRDNSLLQIQMRDFDGFVETRRRILTEKPQNKTHWMAFAVANYLAGNLGEASRIIDQYQSSVQPGQRVKDYEESELVLYKNRCLEEQGLFNEALEHLDKEKNWVMDVFGWATKRAELLLLLGKFTEAVKSFRGLLLEYNTENYQLHRCLQAAVLEFKAPMAKQVLALTAMDGVTALVRLDPKQVSALKAAYQDLSALKPRSRAIKRIPLTFLPIESGELKASLEQYMAGMIRSGVPALAADLSGLYTARSSKQVDPVSGLQGSSHPTAPHAPLDADPGSAVEAGRLKRCKDPAEVSGHPVFQLVLDLAQGFHAAMKAEGALTSGGAKEPPTAYLWCLYLLAQLEEARGSYGAALSLLEEAIAHTPTAVDLYERRARLLRKSGDLEGAALQMEVARKLDLADRYINNKSTKYQLRASGATKGASVSGAGSQEAGLVPFTREGALATFALFTKHDGDVEANLKSMQVSWVANECGQAALKCNEIGPALKKFLDVEKTFEDMIDDQFDFHNYCLRKMTLRSYSSCLQMTATLQHHVHYQRALTGAVRAYLKLVDDPTLLNAASEGADGGNGSQVTEEQLAAMSPAERKKAKQALRKKREKEEKAKAAKAEEETKAAAAAAAAAEEDDGKEKKIKKFPDPPPTAADPDPQGLAHLKKDPMAEAKRLVSQLEKFAPKAATTHSAAFDTAARRGKPLQALRAVLHGRQCDSDDPELFLRLAALGVAASLCGLVDNGLGKAPPPSPITRPAAGAEAKNAAKCTHLLAVSCGGLEGKAKQAFEAELQAALDQAALGSKGKATVREVVQSFAAAHAPGSLPHAICAARATLLLSHLGPGAGFKRGFKDASAQAAKLVGTVAPDAVAPGAVSSGLRRGVSVGACVDALALLISEADEPQVAEAFKAAAAAKFPLSEALGTPERPVLGEGGGALGPLAEDAP